MLMQFLENSAEGVGFPLTGAACVRFFLAICSALTPVLILICFSANAEGVGFEPTVRLRTAVFKTAAFNHSATPPSAYDGYSHFGPWEYHLPSCFCNNYII